MKKLIFPLLLILTLLNLNCTMLFDQTETPPQFPGGETQLGQYIADHLDYPDEAYRAGIEGTVLVKFYVERDGRITNIAVKQGVSPELDQEAVSLVMDMPNWTPGTRGRTRVRSQMMLPVNFVIKR